jgi:hypothetical protein
MLKVPSETFSIKERKLRTQGIPDSEVMALDGTYSQ